MFLLASHPGSAGRNRSQQSMKLHHLEIIPLLFPFSIIFSTHGYLPGKNGKMILQGNNKYPLLNKPAEVTP